MVTFGHEVYAGTELEHIPSPTQQAEQVVAKLNALQQPARPYRLAGDAKYTRDFAFATAKGDGTTINVLIDLKSGGGTIRTTRVVVRQEPEQAPFATAAKNPSVMPPDRTQPTTPDTGRGADAVHLDTPLHECVKNAVPTILDRSGVSGANITVTSVPEITFPIEAEGRLWSATYNAMTGAVKGTDPAAQAPTELSWRRFLLRLHTAHGYPGETNSRWFWAIIVDAMAFTMCFWGLTGLIMWWQIKATRVAGAVVLVLSGVAATALGFAMHSAMTQ
jgi:hypothetical protein